MRSFSCKTIFPLVGPTKLYNVSKTLTEKIRQLSIVYTYRTLRHAVTEKNDVISTKLHFRFLAE